MNPIRRLSSTFPKILLINPTFSAARRRLSTKSGNDEWNDAWEAAWLPDDLSGKNRAPWETDINFALPYDTSNTAKNTQIDPRVTEVDAETKAFVEDMNENWHLRKGKQQKSSSDNALNLNENESLLYSLENIKRDYRLKKQKVHAGLWLKEIEKMEESMLGDSIGVIGDGDDIEKLLDSCSEIFGSPNDDLSNSNMTSEFKNKPDGWETTSKTQDGNIWEMSQREEDILVQEFERRIAFNKFQAKDLGRLKYFLGIEVAQSRLGIVISQCKYALDILEETGMMGCRSIDTPMDPNAKLLPEQGSHSVILEVHILRYIKSSPEKGLLFENRGHEHIIKDYSSKIEAMSISLDIQMLIGQDHPLIDVLHLDIVF